MFLNYIFARDAEAFFKDTLKIDHRNPEAGVKQGSETGVPKVRMLKHFEANMPDSIRIQSTLSKSSSGSYGFCREFLWFPFQGIPF